jgi:hypothetical protein
MSRNDERAIIELTRESSLSALTQFDRRAHPPQRPMFVVSIRHSGISLVEQILASHPAVFGAGELIALSAAARRAAIDRANWRSLAEGYLEAAQTGAGAAPTHPR